MIAWNNQNLTVLGDGKGMDHLEASGIFPALMAAAEECGVAVPED
ncbi:MAG TPA: hypothetical protein VFI01_02260 [Gaiellaceae bacterium]|nr:hypothetical protein [Gaiellaceae bacterium]